MKLFFTFGTLLKFLIQNKDQLQHAIYTEVVFDRPSRTEKFEYKNVSIKRIITLKEL